MNASLPPLCNGQADYLYFSFSARDARPVLRIIRAFTLKGYRVWYDLSRITGPAAASSAAEQAECISRLENAAFVVCIYSPNFLNDRNCLREMTFARSRDKEIIPVTLAKLVHPEYLFGALSLSQVQFYDLSQYDPESAPESLVSSIARNQGFQFSACRDDAGSAWEDSSDSADSSDGFSFQHTGSFAPVRPESPIPCSSPASGRPREEIAAPALSQPPRADEEPDSMPARLRSSGGFLKNLFSAVLSPRAVMPDSYGVIDLHMYTEAQRQVVDRAIQESGGLVRETAKHGFSVRRNTSVTARLESSDLEIKDPLETQVWNGTNLHFDFRFFVPASFSRSEIAFTCYIEYNGIPVTRLNFITAVSAKADQRALPANVIRNDYRKAFISYSRKDEQRMLARVLGIHELAPEMIFWLDKQSMDAGDLWREEIRRAIDISDVLLLFWSVPASRSPEVENEWRYGLDRNGLSFIAPVPLDPPEQCPPPAALSSLNFAVRAFSRNDVTEKLSFYNSRNIRVI